MERRCDNLLFYSSLSSVSAATAETTEVTTAIITAINMMRSPPANKINIVLPLSLKPDAYLSSIPFSAKISTAKNVISGIDIFLLLV